MRLLSIACDITVIFQIGHGSGLGIIVIEEGAHTCQTPFCLYSVTFKAQGNAFCHFGRPP